MQEYLMDEERIITSSKKSNLFLTNFRIRYRSSTSDITSIFLNKVSSIEVRYKNYPLFIILGLLAILGGAGTLIEPMMVEVALAILLLGIILIIIYLVTRRHVITISSSSGVAINFLIKGMKKDEVLNFINQIEIAKHNYTKSLSLQQG